MSRKQVSTHVAIEGLDGAGKSTVIAGIARRLAGDRLVREFALPDPDSVGGAELAAILARRAPAPSPEVLALAFAANRQHSAERAVRPFLDGGPGRLALSHRYVLSGLAYQTHQGLPVHWLLVLNGRVDPPDLTVFIDVPPAVCEARIAARGRAAELFERDHAAMRAAFLTAIAALREAGWPVVVVDGDRPRRAVLDDCLDLVGGSMVGALDAE